MTEKNLVTKFAKIVRARAKHFFGLKMTVKRKGETLTFTVREKGGVGRVESEDFVVDPKELYDMYEDFESLYDYADQLIVRFMFPIRALELPKEVRSAVDREHRSFME